MKALHIVGSRPQFFKVAAVSRAIAEAQQEGANLEEHLLHSGQHYDFDMSEVFFGELELRHPDFYLGVGSGTLAQQVARTLEGVSETLGQWLPDVVLVYGDTNATLAGALAAAQHRVPVIHVEAGVRTGNLHQVEELNRVVTDRISNLRCCCTQHNLDTLDGEGLGEGSHLTGDTMLDNYHYFRQRRDDSIVSEQNLDAGKYILCTIHRAENVDHDQRLNTLLDTLCAAQQDLALVVLPLHPRTRGAIARVGRVGELEAAGVRVLAPLGFKDTHALLASSRLVFTDSGGLLREAYFAGRFCVIPWEYAAWPELVAAGWADAGPLETKDLLARLERAPAPRQPAQAGLFGSGDAGPRIVELVLRTGI